MIRTVSLPAVINKKEAARYLGISGGSEPVSLIDELCPLVQSEAEVRACYAPYDISRDGNALDLGFTKVVSKDLSRNLDGCGRIILFACTAGIGIDRLIGKYKILSPAKAAVISAIGSSVVEEGCDALAAGIKGEFGEVRPRFSCGFGDLPLSLQTDIFRALDVTKNIGVSLSDSLLMTPVKSVTAIIGIKDRV